MQKTKNIIVGVLAAAILVCFGLGAWYLYKNATGGTLKPCLITNNEAEKYFWWQAVSRAEWYEVYLNDTYLTKVEADNNTLIYDYSEQTKEIGNYSFKVRAMANGREPSQYSNVVTVLVENVLTSTNQYADNAVVTDETKSTAKPTITCGVLNWTKVAGVKGYVIMAFNNTGGLNYYYTTANFSSLKNIPNSNAEVLAIKVATLYEGDDNMYVATDGLVYYDPIGTIEGYTDNSSIYLFDGGVYDKYIQNDEEMYNYAYYNFINRNSNYKLLVSMKYKNIITSKGSSYSNVRNYLSKIISEAYMETYAYMDDLYIVSENNAHGYAYNVTWTLKSNEPVLRDIDSTTGIGNGLSNKVTGVEQYTGFTPYYDKVEYTPRDSAYDNFASDNKFLSVNVKTTEQLFWAVEGGFTPTFDTTKCRAYYAYQEAKKILRTIISDQMTDYEKALSIFDYLCINYVYDWAGYYSNTDNPMNYDCYYLEGILLDSDKLSVCDGYSKAYSLMCNMEGIDCIRVTGLIDRYNEGTGHAWNKIKLDDTWYLVDITNTEIKAGTLNTFIGSNYRSVPQYELLAHKYFLVSDDTLNYYTFDKRSRNTENNCTTTRSYYTTNGTIKLHITSDQDLFDMWDYVYANGLSAQDVSFDTTYYAWLIQSVTADQKNIDKLFATYATGKQWLSNCSFRYLAEIKAVKGVGLVGAFIDMSVNTNTTLRETAYRNFVSNYKASHSIAA